MRTPLTFGPKRVRRVGQLQPPGPLNWTGIAGEMTTYYYVLREGGTSPQVRHQTIISARIEAERLASAHEGEVFSILMCVGFSQVSKARTFWVDGIDPNVMT